MSEYDIKAVQLGVRSSNPALPRQWTTMLCSLTAEGIRYSPLSSPEKVMLLIDLAGIESIGNYDTGKSEPAFQVKWQGTTTLHKCADDVSVRNWVDKVMAAKLGPSVPESDEDSDYDSEDDESESSSSEEVVKSSPETGKKLAKSDDKSKPKAKAAKAAKAAKSKTAEPKPKSKSKKEKGKDVKEKEKKGKSSSAKENGSKDSPKNQKRAKSSSSTDSYVPQWAAHYNGIRQQERQKELEALSTEELVRLVSGGLEKIAKEGRESTLQAWSEKKRSKLIELHAIELLELQKRQQRELDELPRQLKEFSEQPL